jgi:hypothetical protein
MNRGPYEPPPHTHRVLWVIATVAVIALTVSVVMHSMQ